ncbi:hypothetical protein WA026_012179 [Henosepilachna vigintioctopunctata]|uniref:Uncharacterized protein n=1 Tax=Henosepilachna vigintioctopunctata TaxID=420089 RepID=A0AAW1VBI4_9CUCU
MSNEIRNHRETSRKYLSCDISSTQNSLYFVMNQRPFISSNFNIYDETRCIFSSSFIGGQPVVISQEQNRKTCDTVMTSITSNQPRIGNCCCPIQQQAPPSNLSWACPLQAQKQGIPEGVLFNFPQQHYSVPLTCMSSAYTPPPPPAPQIVECPYKTPQSVCTDFKKYGLEAMMFQDKLRRPCSFFSYDKKVGTSDQFLYPKSNLCCCGTQSPTLTADQQVENTNRVDDTDCKNKLKVFPWESNKTNREECFCFPKLDSDEIRCAQTGKKEELRKDFISISQQKQRSNSEENICYNYYDDRINRCGMSKPTCLRKYDGLPKDNRNPKKCVSFSFIDKTLSISEHKKNENSDMNTKESEALFNRPVKPQTTTEFKKPLIYRSSNISQKDSSEELNKDRYQCDIIRQITCLKRKRKGLIRMYSFFNDNLNDSLTAIDNEIEDLRGLCPGNSRKKTMKIAPQRRGTSKLGEDYEELGFLETKNENVMLEGIKGDILNSKEDVSVPPPNSPASLSKQKSSDQETENKKELTSEEITIVNKQKDTTNSNLKIGNNTNTEASVAVDAKILLDRIYALAESSGNLELVNLQTENLDQNENYVEGGKHEDTEIKEVQDNEIANEKLQKTTADRDYLKKYIYMNKHTKSGNSITENEDLLNLRRNAISFPKPVEVDEKTHFKENNMTTSFSCTKGLQSCVPGCKVRQSIGGREEDSRLIEKGDTRTYSTDTQPGVVEEEISEMFY